MGMKVKYNEGSEVAAKFEEAMKTLLRTPKPEIDRKQPKKATSRQTSDRD